MPIISASAPYLILTGDDFRTLTAEDFGAPGLTAIESVGPFVGIQAIGPIITIHDSVIEPHLGIGHHPHRLNERIFYMETGSLDHSDSRNDITGHLQPGDLGLFTEGKHGMVHSEWNNGDVPSRIFILVYVTDPVPEATAFTAFRDADAPRYDEGSGVHTKELVGPRSSLRLHGDIRTFLDTTLEPGASTGLSLNDREGGLIAVREGSISVGEEAATAGSILLAPPVEGEREITVVASAAARVIRSTFGQGYGFRLA